METLLLDEALPKADQMRILSALCEHQVSLHADDSLIKDFGNHARLFPADSIKFFFHFMREGIGNVTRGE